MKNRNNLIVVLAVALFSCIGLDNSCSSCTAQEFGADWVVVQFDMFGTPFNCWKMQNVSIKNEGQSDGIWWKNGSGHLVHISGWYNRVQVQNKDFANAAKNLGIDLNRCTDGKYAQDGDDYPPQKDRKAEHHERTE